MSENCEDRLLKKINRGKKRKVNAANWKDNKNKRLRNSGKCYENRKGTIVPAKSATEQLVTCKCKFKCREVTKSQMKSNFNKFYNMNYNQQTNYLASLINLKEPLRRKQLESISKRQVSVEYFLNANKKKIRVCRNTICLTFQITARRIQMLLEKMKNNEILEDKRGLHTNRPHKVTDAEKDSVREHINSFPVEISHYSRNISNRKCLNPSLSVKKMYDLYIEKYPETTLKINTYREVFNTEFNLRFGTPRSDTCKYCDKLFLQLIAAESESEINKIQKETEIHHRRAEKAYSSLKTDSDISKINNSNTIVLCVDLQQVIYTPQLTHSDVFYQRQYANYNFSIHDMKNENATMCIWHESVGKRGSMEIASCILTYVFKEFNILQPGETRKLIIWSDRCVGQNNNWTIIALLHYLIQKKYFTEINQKFLVSGHSFLPCDRDFALIEKRKRVTISYVPDDVIEMIKTSKNTNQFNILKMNQSNFYNLEILKEKITKPKELKITEMRWIQMCSDDPNNLKVRKTHNIVEGWSLFNIIKSSRGRKRRNFGETNIDFLPQLYSEPIRLKKEKIQDLKDMSKYLSDHHRNFYNNLSEN